MTVPAPARMTIDLGGGVKVALSRDGESDLVRLPNEQQPIEVIYGNVRTDSGWLFSARHFAPLLVRKLRERKYPFMPEIVVAEMEPDSGINYCVAALAERTTSLRLEGSR